MGVHRQLRVDAAALDEHPPGRGQPDVEGLGRRAGRLGLRDGLLSLGHVALDHVHADHARPQLGLGVDLGAVETERPLDGDLAVGGPGEDHRAGGGGLGGVVVQQAEVLQVQLQARTAAADQADRARARDLAGLVVLGAEIAEGDLIALQVRIEGQVVQFQAGAEVVQAAAGDRGLTGELRIDQGAAEGAGQMHLAAQLALAPIEQVPQGLHLAVGDHRPPDRPVAHHGDVQRGGGGFHRQGRSDVGLHPLGPRCVGLDVHLAVPQHRFDRGADGGVGRGVGASRLVQPRGHGPVQATAVSVQLHLGVDLADEVLVQRLDVDPAQVRGRGQGVGGLPGVGVQLARAHGKSQPGGAILAGDAHGDRLQGVEVDLPRLARAVQGDLLDTASLFIESRAGQAERALRRIGLELRLERQVRQGPRPGQCPGPDDRAGAAQMGVVGLQADRGVRGAVVDDLQRAGDAALGQHRAGSDGQLQVRRRRGRSAQRQGALGAHAAGVGVDAGQVQPVLRETEGRDALGRAIGTVGVDGDLPVQPPGALLQHQVNMGGLERQVRDIDDPEVRVQVGARRRKGSADVAVALGLAVDLDRSGAERSIGGPGRLQRQRTALVDLALGAERRLVAVQGGMAHGEDAAGVDRLDANARLGAQQTVQFTKPTLELGAVAIDAEPPGRPD